MKTFLSWATTQTYRYLAKPVFFKFDPEFVHEHMVANGALLGKIPPLRKLMAWTWAYQSPKLKKTVDGIRFPNPVGLSAGFDYNADLTHVLPSVGFGFHTIGTITLEPYEGNPKPRLHRFPKSKALLVNKGLKNLGARETIKKLRGKKFSIPVGISIASTNKLFKNETEQIADITACFTLFEKSGLKHAYYELNISCPNTYGGEPFTTPAKLRRLMGAMDKLKLKRPLYIKMPIDQSNADTLAMLKAVEKHNVQGVIFGNLTKNKQNPALHAHDREAWKTMKGNVSGKPTWKRSLELIKLTRKHYPQRFTIIGTGGIFSGEDAVEKLRAGADLLQLITGMIFQGPQLIGQINKTIATEN